MKAANNTIDETIALITAANTVVQNPDAVGTAFKTISMRIRGATTELEEAGLETEGMVQSTAKLRQEIMALSGVDIMEADGQTFKSTYAILDELALKWKDLSDIQQATITELIAGKRQGNIISSLMNNFETARQALETSLKSSGSAMREHEKWQQSLEARINSLKASWQSLSQSFMSSNFLKAGIKVLTGFVDVIDNVINRFGVLNTTIAGFNLYRVFKRGFALDANGNQVGAYFNIFRGLGTQLSDLGKSLGNNISGTLKSNISVVEKLRGSFRAMGRAGKLAATDIKNSFIKSKTALKTMANDIARIVVIMNAMKAVQDIISWMSDAGKEAETAAEKFDRISDELSSVDSELSGLKSELSSVENQIDTLLAKDELSFADKEELSRLRDVSSELEHQIKLTEKLQESLKKSLSGTAVKAYGQYANNTSFYSAQSRQARKEEAKALGGSIGNIAGLIIGGIIGYFAGGNVMLGAAIGSGVGSFGGSAAGGAISDASYYNEVSVRDMLDNMQLERIKLEKAQEEAYETYSSNPSDKNAEAWESAATALNDYNASLANHISQLSAYYNSVDYASLTTDKQREEYLKMGDDLDKYNIEMGVKGAKTTALDRYFSDELITEEAEKLKTAVEAALNSGEDIRFYDLNIDEIINANSRLKEMGLTVTDVISYFKDLKEAQLEASDYETYDIVSNIATLSDGVEKLTDAFREFNEQGVVSAKTLVELNELFGNSGDAWINYVNVMTSGISSIEDARFATEQLAEAHLGNLFANGGIKFHKFNEESDRYEFDKDNYLTYLSTINELEYLGVENAKEYIDALQQQAMAQEVVNKMRADAAEKEQLLSKALNPFSKEALNSSQQKRLSELMSKNEDDYIFDVESTYGIRFENTGLPDKLYQLEEYQGKFEEYKKYLTDIDGLYDDFDITLQKDKELSSKLDDVYAEYIELREEGYNTGESSWEEYFQAAAEVPDAIIGLFGGNTNLVDTKYDEYDRAEEELEGYAAALDDNRIKRQEYLDELFKIADKANIDLSDINVSGLDDNEYFKQVYDRVKSGLEDSTERFKKLADELSAEIDEELNNLGLELDFGRHFDKIIIDGFKLKTDQLNTAKSEMFSSGGLSTDSIIAVDDIFGDLSSYDSSKLFENTANGVRLNTEEFRRLSNEFKTINIDGLENKMSDLGDQYVKTREELYNLTYGTEEYNEKARELADIEGQIAANEELISQYKGLFSAFQEWQRAESTGSERNMYETILGGFETVGDEISRGWVDDGTREFLELLKGDTATIVDGNGVAKEINLATASAKELKQVWKGLDKDIKHTSYSVRDFFTVDDEGNSTSQGVYNFLDAIGQMEEESFGGKDVVKRDGKGNIIGFDFQIVGGDKAIAEALGISEELVQIMKRAAIDAGFVVTFDGSFEQLDVLREKAQIAAEEMNKILKADGKKTIDIDMNVDSVEDVQSQLDKIMNAFGKKDGNGKLTGAIDMDIKGADQAIQIASTLQSMKDKLTRPAYMDIQISQVEEELRDPLQSLQDYRTNIEQLNQAKLRGADTTDLEKSIEDSKEKVVADLLEIQENNPKLAAELDIKGLSKEELIKKVETGEIKIPATVDIQLSMDEKLGILADKALYDAGLISEEEFTKRVQVYLEANVDSEEAENEVDGAVDGVVDVDDTNRQKDIKIIANVLGIDDVDGLSSKLEGLDNKTVQAIAEVIGQVDVNKLKLALGTMTDVQVRAIAEAIGKGDVEGLKTAIGNLDTKTVQAIAEAFGYSDVNELNTAIENLDPKVVQAIAQALGLNDVNTLQTTVNNMKGNTVDAVVNTAGQAAKVNALQTKIDSLKGKIVDVGVKIANAGKSKAAQRTGADPAGNDSDVNGTANVNGTIGKAYKQGNWRTKRTETALTGELGREIVVTPNNQWYTVGDNGAEFVNIPRGSIVFNHRQTEELLRNGKATSDGGRARALVNGTALLGGTAHRGDGEWVGVDVPSFKVGYDYKSSGSSNSDSKKSQEIFDWIEVAIERIEREIDNLDRIAGSTYKSWSSRNKALADEISEVGNEIALQEKAYEGYMNAANEIGLSSEWKKKVQSGAIDIDNITDETLAEKIKDYQKYFEQALACKDAIEELRESESKLYAQRFENIQTRYDGILQGYEHTEAMLNEYISQAEEQGYIVSKKYYKALIDNEKSNIAELKKEQADLIAERDNAVDSGAIAKYSEEWYDMCSDIDSVTKAIEEGNTALLEYARAMEEIDWRIFDLIQERISDITAESDFLIELMSNKDLFDDNGKFTEQGIATMGLHALNYNTAMYQSDDYGKEIDKLNKQISKDPYDQELINRRNELLELQRESILAAESEKQAIKDLVEEGINLELDALQERIDLHNEELDSMKDLYDYQKDVEKQAENIASLRKQLGAYEGFDDDETRAKVQELKVSLEEAEADLQETEYDKFISDQTALLDALYTEYETILNSRFDNIDFLLEQVIDGINTAAGADGTITSALGADGAIAAALGGSATTIGETLKTEVGAVGTKLSTAMSSIWLGDGSGKAILDLYGKDFQNRSTTANDALNSIKSNVNAMVDDVDKDAKKKVEANKTTTSAKKNQTTTATTNKPASSITNTNSNKQTVTDDTIKGIAAAIWIYGKNSGWGNNPFRENKLSDKIGASNAKKVQDYINKHGSNGDLFKYWTQNGKNLDKYKYNAFKLGAKDIDATQLAWTQENGQEEFIVRPSDGAILTPVARGDSVLTSAASNNIWDMANSPAEFIRDNLGIDSANVPNNSNVNNSVIQNFENITFSMPNVHGYNDLLAEMQRDPKFEKLVLSMTVDRIAGRSSLAKRQIY